MDETTSMFFGAEVRRVVFPAWIISLSQIQSDEINIYSDLGNVQGNQLNLLGKYQIFPWCDQLGVLLVRCQKTWHPKDRNLPHDKFMIQNIFNSLTGYANSVGHLIYSKSAVIHHRIVNAINCFGSCWQLQDVLTLGYIQDSPFPHLNSAAYFCSADKAGVPSFPNIATMNVVGG